MGNRLSISLIILIAITALAARLIGNRFGLIHTGALAQAGYPLPSTVTSSIIPCTYVYDEESFTAFLPFFHEVKAWWADWRRGEISTAALCKACFKAARARQHMGVNPVGPVVYGCWAAAVKLAGTIVHSAEVKGESLETIFFLAGRFLGPLISTCVLIPMFFLCRKAFGRSKHADWLCMAGSAFISLQPGHVVHGHWISYNPLVTLMELTGFFWALRIIEHVSPHHNARGYRDSLLFGAFLGLGLAAKYTTASVGAVVITGMIIRAAGIFGWRRLVTAYWKSPYFLYPLCMCGAAAGTYCAIIGPAFFSDEIAVSSANQCRMALSLDDLKGASRSGLLLQYFIHTLPQGIGWPLYLVGWAGLIARFTRWRRTTINERLLALWALVFIAAFTSNELGPAPQRALTVYALWTIFALWGLDVCSQKSRVMTAILLCYLLAGYAFQSMTIDYYLVKDTDGYRTEASAYVLKNIPAGAMLYFNANDKDALIDLAMFECQAKAAVVPLYRYAFFIPCRRSVERQNGYAVCFNHQKVDGILLAEFSSCIKHETHGGRFLRMFFGHHRCDQLVLAPSYRIYGLSNNDAAPG